SPIFYQLISTQMVFGSYEVGIMERTPFPHKAPRHLVMEMATLAQEMFYTKWRPESLDECNRHFLSAFDVMQSDLPSRLEDFRQLHSKMERLVEAAFETKSSSQILPKSTSEESLDDEIETVHPAV